jgi:hypothetical protein
VRSGDYFLFLDLPRPCQEGTKSALGVVVGDVLGPSCLPAPTSYDRQTLCRLCHVVPSSYKPRKSSSPGGKTRTWGWTFHCVQEGMSYLQLSVIAIAYVTITVTTLEQHFLGTLSPSDKSPEPVLSPRGFFYHQRKEKKAQNDQILLTVCLFLLFVPLS